MIRALKIVGRAIRLWYDDLITLMAINILWFLLQIPIVTGPIATATVYVVAQRVINKEYLEFRPMLSDMRRMILPGLTWGFVNLVVIGVTVVNFVAYQDVFGLMWGILRVAWGFILLVWLVANIFYWPFWLVQSDRRFLTTYRNSFIFIFKNPGLSLSVFAICILLVVVSVVMTVPLVVILITWLSLIGMLTVEEGLRDLDSPNEIEGS
ncbi:MAG: hypothetical protein GTO18_00610 [Anaerolineales bacterium]|nr:hypothetical protein [Anaerolineales bacterium]